jgi:L-histidine N-alpha-methyltransferase
MTLLVKNHLPLRARRAALEADVLVGLGTRPKRLSPVWFYDERGSQLFEEITRLPEYYLTRAERSILDVYGPAIIEAAQCGTLIELGSGSSEKTRSLLDSMAGCDLLSHYVPLDVSEEILVQSAHRIHADYDIDVTAVIADFTSQLHVVPGGGRRLFTFLGSTIGNFDPLARAQFFGDLGGSMSTGDRFLLGADLVKGTERMVAAYNDSAGVTAEFNLNVLRVLNEELGADFDPDRFEHQAIWDADNSWIEMRLIAREGHHVSIDAVGLDAYFAPGEALRTEISTKFTVEGLDTELKRAGVEPEMSWHDERGDFELVLARRTEPDRTGPN